MWLGSEYVSANLLEIYSKFTVFLQLYWIHTSAWVFSCKFAVSFQNIFLWEHTWRAASDNYHILKQKEGPVIIFAFHIREIKEFDPLNLWEGQNLKDRSIVFGLKYCVIKMTVFCNTEHKTLLLFQSNIA